MRFFSESPDLNFFQIINIKIRFNLKRNTPVSSLLYQSIQNGERKAVFFLILSTYSGVTSKFNLLLRSVERNIQQGSH